MKICNSCGFECEKEAVICPTCGKNTDGSDSAESTREDQDPFREYRQEIDRQIKDQAKRIEEIKLQMQKEQQEKDKKQDSRNKAKWDKTELFSEDEVKEYRLTAVLIYLLGIFGIFLALLTDRSSEYIRFHMKEAMKTAVLTAFLGIIAIIFFWSFVIPVICLTGIIVCCTVNLISAYRTLKGKSENAVLVRNLSFLN